MIQEERCECGERATIDYQQPGALHDFWEQHRGDGHRDLNAGRKRLMAYALLGSDYRARLEADHDR